MNLHGIVSGAIGAINPKTELILRVSTGYATAPDGTRAPSYANPVTVHGQVQPLAYNEIVQMDGLQIQGEKRRIYITGEVDGMIRSEGKGGDLFTLPDGSVWKVVIVFEYFPDWCSVGVVLQDNA
jgi:hypothetical protein